MHLEIFYGIKYSHKAPIKKSRVHKVLFFINLQRVPQDTFLRILPSL